MLFISVMAAKGKDQHDKNKSKAPSKNIVLQQKAPVQQLVFTGPCVISTFLIVGLVLLIIGSVALSQRSNIKSFPSNGSPYVYFDVSKSSSLSCGCTATERSICSQTSSSCAITVVLENDIPGPVYFYYTLTNFFQNHRRYVASQDPVQYRDKWTVDAAGLPSTGSFGACWPLETYNETVLGKQETIYYYPCGLGALSMFNDTFQLQDSNSNTVQWSKEGISWRASLKGRYQSQSEAWLRQNCRHLGGYDFSLSGFSDSLKNFSGSPSGRYNCWHNVSDEDFMVWMRPAASSSFWKLHRIIPNGLKKGAYTLIVNINFPVASFKGTKGFVLTNANTFGTDPTFVGAMTLAVGCISLVCCAGLLVLFVMFPGAIQKPEVKYSEVVIDRSQMPKQTVFEKAAGAMKSNFSLPSFTSKDYPATADDSEANDRREVECPPDPHKHFESNYVKTNKYTVLTFLPLNLFLQFHRLANCYFLVIAILASTPLSPVTGTTYWFPLISVLAISAIKDASEDYRRYKSDIEENSRVTEVFNSDTGDFEQVPWKEVTVGSIVRVKTGDEVCTPMVPADLSLLCTSAVDGTCFLETANLDGETNLKIREAPEVLHKHLVGEPHQADGHSVDCKLEKLKALKMKINCHIPDALLYDFNARAEWEGQDIPLSGGASGGQLMQRSTKLKNTKWCIGLAVYTGKETKIQMNMTDPPNKVSNIERKLNVFIVGILMILGLLCLIGAIGAGTMNNSTDLKGAWYLSPQNTSISFNVQKPGTTGFLAFFTFLILLSLLVPISLYVSVEMVKLVISILISSDREMYSEEDDIPSKARSLGLCEELGQINYIFSDKTGTLTQNLMEFKKCSIGGVEYGQGFCEVERAIARRQGRELPEDPIPPPGADPGFKFVDERLMSGKWRESQDRKVIEDFLFNMAVNHNAQVEYNEDSNIPVYQAESPDEGAFVQAARNLGVFFSRRNMKEIHIKMSHGPVGEGVEAKWTVLNFNAFDNNRKRTSVVISDEGRTNILLLIKGADTSVMPFIDVNACPYYRSTQQQVDKFGEQGLRTLVFAGRSLDPEYYSAWNEKFKKASLLSDGREKALRQLACELEEHHTQDGCESVLFDSSTPHERSLTLHGVTALEDKLQENVGECISQLAKAMIKIWVLTGDKLETAINIGFATALLTQEMEPLNRISQDDMLSDDPEWSKGASEYEQQLTRCLDAAHHRDTAQVKEICRSGRQDSSGAEVFSKVDEVAARIKRNDDAQGYAEFLSIESKLKDALLKERVRRKVVELNEVTKTPKPGGWALVIDGTCLRAAATPELKLLFLEASVRCKAVVCCRVTPSQKAQMTLLVKDNIPGQITLAIGDGANDVSMIQAAHIGIGIRGKEGQQAVLASDYALPRFAYLERLLLIHGRWSYNRIGTMVCYFFYKNISYAFTLFWFSVQNAFSAQPLYDDGYQALYNLVFTSLPVMFFAVLDRDLHPSVVRAHPELYSAGHFNVRFSVTRFSMFIVGAILHATILYFVTQEMLDLNSYGSSGRSQDLWAAGTTTLTNVVWTVTIVMGLHTRSWTWMHWFVYVGSILVWYLFLLTYNGFAPLSLGSWDTEDNVYDVIYELGDVFLFWLSTFVTVSMCTLPILCYKYCREQYFPNIDDYYRRVVQNPSLYPAEHLPSSQQLDIKICQPHERNFGSRGYSPDAAREATKVEEEEEAAGVAMEARRGPPQTSSGSVRPKRVKKDSQGILEVQSSSP
mmetsp:Transcript_11831/g.27255  ORF Transcript_11831/g.27255 Transcript_11831/m.27255 type:complete len:1730 (-) Transcript_11831:60-5249(-)